MVTNDSARTGEPWSEQIFPNVRQDVCSNPGYSPHGSEGVAKWNGQRVCYSSVSFGSFFLRMLLDRYATGPATARDVFSPGRTS